MAQELAGKVTIVTGGANGIGRGIVELFVEEGAKVVVADIDDEAGRELAASLGPACRFQRTDVTRREDIDAVIALAVAEFGGLHVMVNNVGFPSKIAANVIELDFDDFQKVMNLNVLSTMLGSVHAARHMARHGGGSIVNVSSVAGVLPGPGPLTYRAAKAGVNQFSRSIAIDLARFNIRVNVIAPYNIVTKIARGLVSTGGREVPEEKFQELEQVYRTGMMAAQPLKRQGEARDVANAVLFYASDRSLQVTGTVLPVDGGYTTGDAISSAEAIATAQDKVTADL